METKENLFISNFLWVTKLYINIISFVTIVFL